MGYYSVSDYNVCDTTEEVEFATTDTPNEILVCRANSRTYRKQLVGGIWKWRTPNVMTVDDYGGSDPNTVRNSDRLNGQISSYYATYVQADNALAQALIAKADAASVQSALSTISVNIPTPLFDSTTSVSSTNNNIETDLYNYTLPANKISVDKQNFFAEFTGTFPASLLGTQIVKFYFYKTGTVSPAPVFNSGALSLAVASSSWTLRVWGKRISTTSMVVTAELLSNGISTALKQTTVTTSVDFTVTSVIKLTAQTALIAAGMTLLATSGKLEATA